MLVYRFRAYTRIQTIEGEVVAWGAKRAEERLRKYDEDLEIEFLKLDRKATIRAINDRWFPVPRTELANLFRQLHLLIASGVEISKSLRVLAESSPSGRLREALFDMDRGIHEGNMLSAMMRKHPTLFSPFLCGMVAVGEQTGAFQEVLERAASLLEKDSLRVRRLQAALVYPAFLLLASIGLMAGMMLIFLPKMADVLRSLGADINLPLQILLWSGALLSDGTFVGLSFLFGLGLVAVLLMWFATPGGQLWRDRWVLKVPIFRRIFLALSLSRFAYSLCLVIRCGMPISASMETVGATVGNRVVADGILEAKERLVNGDTLSEALMWDRPFQGMFLQMIEVGEESCRLGTMLEYVQNMYGEELDAMLDVATQLIEPFILMFMGVMVGAMVVVFMLPIAHLVSKL